MSFIFRGWRRQEDGEKILFMSDWGTHGNPAVDNLTYLVQYNQALPVTWVSPLAVRLIEEQALLSWSVSEQINNEKFIIEHSIDGHSFTIIGEVTNKEDLSTTVQKYNFVHENPANGNNYYRIKQVDYDGHFAYTPIVSVFVKKGEIAVFPVPAENYIIIRSSTDGYFFLYNHLGLKLREGSLVAGDNQLNVADLSNGIYFLKTKSGIVHKVIIQ